jgi:spore cortex biosynthesis protein YabQ
MLLFGHFLAFIFDLYRVVRGFGYLDNIFTKIIDFVFCLLAAIMTFIILLRSNLGQIRFYIFISLALGILLYNRLLSKFVLRYSRLLLEILIKGLKKHLQFMRNLYKLIKDIFLKLREKLLKFKN